MEIFDEDGTTLLSQGAEFKINGQYSRALDQKSFAVYARKEYGDSRFNAALFDDRDYTSYKSFVLRCTAQDYNRARMRDAMMTSLMEGQGVMYQETEVCVLYLNGEYWGHYNMRERVNKWSIAQWEGVTDEDGNRSTSTCSRATARGRRCAQRHSNRGVHGSWIEPLWKATA